MLRANMAHAHFLYMSNISKKMNRIISRVLNCAILVFASIYLTSCATFSARAPSKGAPLRLDSISLDKKSFNPDAGEFVNIRYKPSRSCSATITICDSWGIPVKVLADNRPVSSRSENITWNGLDEKGTLVASGVYFYVVELKDEDTGYIYNPYRGSHGITLKSVTGSYDREKGEINYTLPQAARVRIRVGLKDGGPLLITPLDWTTKIAGRYTLKWDGKDGSGNINLAAHPKRNLVIFAYTLADNSIIIESDREPSIKSKSDIPALFSPELALDRDRHARNYFTMSHEPGISMGFQGNFKKTEEGMLKVQGIVPVKVSIAPEDRLALENSRYEIMFFVDTVFLFEEEAGFTPFTYMWDTRGLSEGEHLLTVNLWSYEDNCGVVTKRVFVQKDKQ